MAVRFLAGITYNSYDVRLIFRYRMEWQPNRRMEKWESGKKSKIYQMSNADRSLSQTLVRLNVFGIEMIWELMAFILRNGRIITCDSGKRCNHDPMSCRVVSSSSSTLSFLDVFLHSSHVMTFQKFWAKLI